MININGNLYKNIDSNNINDFTFIITNFNFYEEIHFENELLFFWEDHFFRIMASLRRLRYKIPVSFNKEFLKNELIKTIVFEDSFIDEESPTKIKLRWRTEIPQETIYFEPEISDYRIEYRLCACILPIR